MFLRNQSHFVSMDDCFMVAVVRGLHGRQGEWWPRWNCQAKSPNAYWYSPRKVYLLSFSYTHPFFLGLVLVFMTEWENMCGNTVLSKPRPLMCIVTDMVSEVLQPSWQKGKLMKFPVSHRIPFPLFFFLLFFKLLHSSISSMIQI